MGVGVGQTDMAFAAHGVSNNNMIGKTQDDAGDGDGKSPANDNEDEDEDGGETEI